MYRDVKWKEIADRVQEELPVYIPKPVVRIICRSILGNIFRILRRRRSKIVLRNADIHTIYYDPGQQH